MRRKGGGVGVWLSVTTMCVYLAGILFKRGRVLCNRGWVLFHLTGVGVGMGCCFIFNGVGWGGMGMGWGGLVLIIIIIITDTFVWFL